MAIDSGPGAPGLEPMISQGLDGAAAALPEFIGRTREIAEIATLLETTRLVTLTGPPGIGKSRLALEAARRFHSSDPRGVLFVDLAPVHDPARVPQVVDSLFGADPAPVALLVLDNCEHLVEVCASLAERVIADRAGISLLATSQQPLGISAEQTKAVGGLPVPEPTPTSSMAAAGDSEAIRLFCTRAAARRPNFELTEENLAAITVICRRLDGIPLAIELAAARLLVLGPTDIAERIDQRFDLLTQGDPGGLARHRTLRAALDWSYGRLANDEALVFRRMSVFAGGASLAAVQYVCVSDDIGSDDIRDLLNSLVAKSVVVAETRRARTRYRMLETIRAYGGDRLKEAEEADALSRRHATWYSGLLDGSSGGTTNDDSNAGLVGENYGQFSANRQRAWTRVLETEHDNLRAAIEWALGADPSLALSLAIPLLPLWETASANARPGGPQ